MRSFQLLVLLALAVAPSIAQGTAPESSKRALLAADTELTTETSVNGRKVLCFAGNCIRSIATVQQHKTPQAPTLKRKTFETKMPKRALLETELTAETGVQTGRKLNCFAGNCIRSIATVQQHKTPQAPTLKRKTFEQKMPKRALLETELATETGVQTGRKLNCFAGNCIRSIATVQQHKTPQAPRLTRKNFDRKMPKRALLQAETELAIDTLAEGSRKLLCFAGSCVRGIAKVQSHKTPNAPSLTRKSFEQKMPKRALLAAEMEAQAVVESGRKLLCFAGSCVRGIAKVQSHKTPNAPSLTRKSFEQKMPKRAL